MRTTNEQTSQIMPKLFFVLFILFCSSIQPALAQVPAPDFDVYAKYRLPMKDAIITMKISENVRVILPADIRAGDAISGTVISNVTGTLEGTVIEVKTVEGEVVATKKSSSNEISSTNEFFTFTVPQGVSSLVLSCTGQHYKSAKLFTVSPNPGLTPGMPTQPDFAPPRLGQTGRDISIPGNFDGNARTTTVNIGGRQVPVIAESPRQTVMQIPADMPTGPGTLTINETGTGNSQTAPFNVVSLQLSADKLNLRSGEKTNLHILVFGLGGGSAIYMEYGSINKNGGKIKLRLENVTPQIVALDTGIGTSDIDWYSLKTVSMNGGDAFRYTTQLTGVSPGNFQIIATLFAPQDPPKPLKEQLEDIAAKKESAANAVSGNSKVPEKLTKNAEKVKGWIETEFDEDGNPKNKDDLIKKLKAEKEELKKLKTNLAGGNDDAVKKIGEAMDAVEALIKILEAK